MDSEIAAKGKKVKKHDHAITPNRNVMPFVDDDHLHKPLHYPPRPSQIVQTLRERNNEVIK